MSPEQILLAFIQGEKGERWANIRAGWSPTSTEPVCNWHGVICTEGTTVTGLFLPESDLTATIPPEIGYLSSLSSLTLSQNNIYGSIPASLSAISNLEFLNLSNNYLTGNIPAFSSEKLQSLNLGYNELGGTIPVDIGNRHPALMEFDIMKNKIKGPIPASLSLMSALDELSLANNGLTGTIPSQLGKLTGMQYLYLNDNYLMGFIPPALARVDSQLREIWVQGNLLSGTIPTTISDMKELTNLYVDGNKFTGSVPQELCRKELNEDFFADVTEKVTRNYCESIACPVGHVSREGVYPCVECEDRFFNPYLGRLGKCLDINQRDILMELAKSTGGYEGLWTEFNWDVEDSFLCQFTGVTCDDSNHVVQINLKGMGLTGTIPESVGFLRYLEVLDVSDNHLTGLLPSDLRYAPLEKLDISGNNIKGIVPPTLCLKADINQNGNDGDYNCNTIACSVGTYSAKGNGSVCLPCSAGLFLGMKSCSHSSPLGSTFINVEGGGMTTAGKVFLSAFIVGIAFSIYKFIRQKRRRGDFDSDFSEWDDRLHPDEVVEDIRLTVNLRMNNNISPKESNRTFHPKETSLTKNEAQYSDIPEEEIDYMDSTERTHILNNDDDSLSSKRSSADSRVSHTSTQSGSVRSGRSKGRAAKINLSRRRMSNGDLPTGIEMKQNTNEQEPSNVWLDVPRI